MQKMWQENTKKESANHEYLLSRTHELHCNSTYKMQFEKYAVHRVAIGKLDLGVVVAVDQGDLHRLDLIGFDGEEIPILTPVLDRRVIESAGAARHMDHAQHPFFLPPTAPVGTHKVADDEDRSWRGSIRRKSSRDECVCNHNSPRVSPEMERHREIGHEPAISVLGRPLCTVQKQGKFFFITGHPLHAHFEASLRALLLLHRLGLDEVQRSVARVGQRQAETGHAVRIESEVLLGRQPRVKKVTARVLPRKNSKKAALSASSAVARMSRNLSEVELESIPVQKEACAGTCSVCPVVNALEQR